MTEGRLGDPRPAWPWVVAALAVGLLAVAAIWLDAFPRGPVCPAVYPGDPSCTVEHRQAASLVATVVVAAVTVGVVALVVTVGRRRRGVAPRALLGQVACGLVAYGAALSSTGYVVSW